MKKLLILLLILLFPTLAFSQTTKKPDLSKPAQKDAIQCYPIATLNNLLEKGFKPIYIGKLDDNMGILTLIEDHEFYVVLIRKKEQVVCPVFHGDDFKYVIPGLPV